MGKYISPKPKPRPKPYNNFSGTESIGALILGLLEDLEVISPLFMKTMKGMDAGLKDLTVSEVIALREELHHKLYYTPILKSPPTKKGRFFS